VAAAANFAWANRRAIADAIRGAIARVLGKAAAESARQVYDVAHNIAKTETYDGLVHRKGATRALLAGSEEIPGPYRPVGQLIPGSMGTSSCVLAGEPGSIELAYGTACHGAGRTLSRTAASGSTAPSCATSSTRAASSPAAPPTRASPNKHRSPTRTSTAPSTSSPAPASPDRSRNSPHSA
jgi:tRNA-splicing ligase RtcB